MYLFLEGGREEEREGEKHGCVRETWISQTQGDLEKEALFFFFFFLRCYLFIFRQREGREKERERNINVWLVAPHTPPTGDLAHNPGMCPDWELNQ